MANNFNLLQGNSNEKLWNWANEVYGIWTCRLKFCSVAPFTLAFGVVLWQFPLTLVRKEGKYSIKLVIGSSLLLSPPAVNSKPVQWDRKKWSNRKTKMLVGLIFQKQLWFIITVETNCKRNESETKIIGLPRTRINKRRRMFWNAAVIESFFLR